MRYCFFIMFLMLTSCKPEQGTTDPASSDSSSTKQPAVTSPTPGKKEEPPDSTGVTDGGNTDMPSGGGAGAGISAPVAHMPSAPLPPYLLPPTIVIPPTPQPSIPIGSNSSCTATSTVRDYAVHGMLSILGDGVDKGGFDFQISSDKKVNIFYLYIRAPNTSSIEFELYEGGTLPGNGQLISQITKTSELGSSDYAQLSFTPTQPILIKAGVKYFIILKGTGSSYYDVALDMYGYIVSGGIWPYDGNYWQNVPDYTVDLGFSYETSCY